jgi:hypothetical protein
MASRNMHAGGSISLEVDVQGIIDEAMEIRGNKTHQLPLFNNQQKKMSFVCSVR